MDSWFPILVLFCGIFLQAALQTPGAAEKIARLHPLPGSYARMDKVSWIFISVGSLWQIQNLLV